MMLANLYSALPLPMQRTISPSSVLYDKLTTIVFTQFNYDYIHIYEKSKNVYKYVRTIKLSNK